MCAGLHHVPLPVRDGVVCRDLRAQREGQSSSTGTHRIASCLEIGVAFMWSTTIYYLR